MVLRPFIRYYGAKWRAAPLYPAPRHRTLIEPFAGAAGYALHHPERDVILVEKYKTLAEMWRWLIAVREHEVLAIPTVDNVDDLPAGVAAGARTLIGFSMNAACASPRKKISAGGLRLRAKGRQFYGWTEAMRSRVADQVQHIRHWKVIEGDYSSAPDVEATWFIDPPYRDNGGGHYVHGAAAIDYAQLANWCQLRRGQTIVCEGANADYLPFEPLAEVKAGPGKKATRECLWISDRVMGGEHE